MIKANELRIGSWINYKAVNLDNGDYIDKPIKVRANEIKDASIHINNEYSPIPLTPEILTKFKFDFVDFVLAFCDKNHIIHECGESGEFWWEFHPFCTNDTDCHLELHYVHELQNILFVFSGEDIQVDL